MKVRTSMRRNECEISTTEAWQVFDESKYATLTCVKADGAPYAVSLSVARVHDKVYFHSALEGEKNDILAVHPQVCVSAVSEMENAVDAFTTYFSSCILYGIAESVEDIAEKKEALRAICMKHTPTLMGQFEETADKALAITQIFRIQVSKITGKRKSRKLI